MLALALGLTLGASAPQISVELPAQPGPCGFSELASALRRRLPGATLRPELLGEDRRDVRVRYGERDGRWTLTIRAGDAPPLRRELPSPGVDCVALSETAALMLERYLDEVHWGGGEAARLAPLAPPPAVPPTEAILSVGAWGGMGPLGLAPGGEGGLAVARGRWRFGAVGDLLPSRSAVVAGAPGATLAAQAGNLELAGGPAWPVGSGDFRLELVPGAELLWASSSGGRLFQHRPGLAASPFAGARAGFELPLGERFDLALRLTGRAFFARNGLSVEGFGAEALPAPFDAAIALAIERRFF